MPMVRVSNGGTNTEFSTSRLGGLYNNYSGGNSITIDTDGSYLYTTGCANYGDALTCSLNIDGVCSLSGLSNISPPLSKGTYTVGYGGSGYVFLGKLTPI